MRCFFDEEDFPEELEIKSEVVYSWENSLGLLDKNSHWFTFCPVKAHLDFAIPLVKVITNKLYTDSESNGSKDFFN